MNNLASELTRNLDGELSCPACGSHDVVVLLYDHVSKNNPLGEQMGSIQCRHDGCQLAKDVRVDELKEAIKQWMIGKVETYTCFFEFKGREYEINVPGGITQLVDGLWVDQELQYAKIGEAVYWIPAAKVNYVEKTTEEKRLG